MESCVNLELYVGDLVTNRKNLFRDAIKFAKFGKVLYILYGEFEELPQLSQDLSLVNKHYMKMISFLYANTIDSLIESLSSLPDWQSVPATIILEDLSGYCPKLPNACGITAFLKDAARSCAIVLNSACRVRMSINELIGEDYCNTLQELYCMPNLVNK